MSKKSRLTALRPAQKTQNALRLLNKDVWHAKLARTTALTLAGMLALSSSAFAVGNNETPTGGNVVGGTANINYSGPANNNMVVTQTGTNRTVIDWNSFNIGRNASGEFQQLNMDSMTVNRVVGPGNDPSQILGTLKSTVGGQTGGTIMILDPNGVLFGANSVIDAGGMIASTGQLNDVAGFLAGGPNSSIVLNNTDSKGNRIVENRGRINIADGGMLALVAPTVRNSGVINARRGFVSLAAGKTATLDFYGDNLINISLSGELDTALVENSAPRNAADAGGQIYTDGGVVSLTAGAAKSVVDSVVNMHGVVRANSFSNQNGRIVLSSAGQTNVSGRLEARSNDHTAGQNAISITGNDVNITSNSHRPASEIKDGIFADTLGPNGNGGKVYVWGANRVTFAGHIDVSGGSNTGNGGHAEISGNGDIAYRGVVDASAANGHRGTLTIDPSIVRIGNSVIDPIVNAAALAQTLGLTNVHIIAGDKVILVDDVNLSHWNFGSISVTNGDLTLEAPTVELAHDLIMGYGRLDVNANTVNLSGRIYRNTSPLYPGLLKQLMTQAHLSGNASVVNVLGNSASIQQGIDLAGSGATVYVASDTYSENVNIYKSLTLQGQLSAGGLQPLLFGTTSSGSSIVLVTADNVTVDGFNIIGQNDISLPPSVYAIQADNVSGLRVANNNLTGVLLNNVTSAHIVDNIVAGSSFGISAEGGMNLLLSSNSVLANSGISVANASNVQILSNIVSSSLSDGISLINSRYSEISDNQVDSSGQDGISVSDGEFVLVSGNSSILSGRYGIALINGTLVRADLNSISSSGSDGIFGTGLQRFTVNLNDIFFSGRDGINLADSINGTIAGNEINGAFNNAINVAQSSRINIKNNDLSDSSKNAIKLEDVDNLIVQNNDVSQSTENGLDVTNSTNIKIQNNSFLNNGNDGIYAANVEVLVINNNSLDFSGRDGIHGVSNINTNIIDNSIGNSDRDGIFITDSAGAFVYNNIVNNSGRDGLGAYNSDGFSSVENTLNAAGRDGIHLVSSNASNLIDNSIKDAANDGIHLSLSADSSVMVNDIINSGRDGIFTRDSNGLWIYQNKINIAGRDGINIRDANGASVLFNTVKNTADDGVDIGADDESYIQFNTIENSGQNGIQAKNSNRLIITQNFIYNSGNDAIKASDVTSLQIQVNRIDGASDNGLGLSGVIGGDVSDNKIRNVSGDGVNITDASGLILFRNAISFTGHDGIHASNAGGLILSYNTLSSSGRDGINIGGSDDVYIDNNSIQSLGRDGIRVRGGSNSFVTNNTLLTGSGAGINLLDGASATFVGSNSVTGFYDGVRVAYTFGTTLADNGIYSSLNDGIQVDYAVGALVRNNAINGFGDDGVQISNSEDVTLAGNAIDGLGTSNTGVRLGSNEDPFVIGTVALSGNASVVIQGNNVQGNTTGLDARALNNGSVDLQGNIFTGNTVGLWASSGAFNLDTPNLGNTFNGGQIAMVFDGPFAADPVTGYSGLSLVGDTLGETVFNGQSQYYVDLRNGAFFSPGQPTNIDGLLASYDGLYGGALTLNQLIAIRTKINDYIDDSSLGLIFAGDTTLNLDDNQILRRFVANRYASGRASVVVTGLPGVSSAGLNQNSPSFTAGDLANLAPATGGNDAAYFAEIEPAAGGESSQTAPQNLVNASCWGQLGGGATAMTFDLGDDATSVLKDQSACQI